MYSKTLFAIASAAMLGSVAAEDAKIVENNPHGVSYTAKLPEKPFFAGADLKGNVVGSISATAADNGVGTKFTVKFSNLPKSGGPFIYHLHVKPASGGNCTATLGHLDPTKRGEQPPCDASSPQTCQVGDLSGKYGKITSDPFTAEYTDPFTSLVAGNPAFFGDAAFVLHYANTTRLTCADFVKVDAPQYSPPPQVPDCTVGQSGYPQSTGYGSPTGGYSSAPAQSTGGYASPSASTTVQTSRPSAGQGTATGGKPSTTVPVSNGAPKMAVAGSLLALGAVAMML